MTFSFLLSITNDTPIPFQLLMCSCLATLNSRYSASNDLSNIISQLDGLGRLVDTGQRPLIILAQNALTRVFGSSAGQVLNDVISALEKHYGGEKPLKDIPTVPEVLIFDGRDERVSYIFIQNALQCGASVARLYVPRIINGKASGNGMVGTGWLLTPELLLTNHHVIDCRGQGEPSAYDSDLRAQAKQTIAWFDYYHGEVDLSRIEVYVNELIYSNSKIDYAVLRLQQPLTGRGYLRIIRQQPSLEKGTRLNIVQHPKGGALRYAIRNNFFVGTGQTSDYLRYLTDTEPGSSGSPVFDERWQVVGLHRGYNQIQPEEYKGEVVRYHNEGIAIHTILKDLPDSVQHEINLAQQWEEN